MGSAQLYHAQLQSAKSLPFSFSSYFLEITLQALPFIVFLKRYFESDALSGNPIHDVRTEKGVKKQLRFADKFNFIDRGGIKDSKDPKNSMDFIYGCPIIRI